jgi:glycosyltransferase involved in cell wall biosynthesis
MSRRIAVVTHAFPAVSETFVLDHVEGLVRHGFEVVVVADRLEAAPLSGMLDRACGRLSVKALSRRPAGAGAAARAAADLVGAVARAPALTRSALGRSLCLRVPALARALRAAQPDLIHAHFASNGLAAALATSPHVPVIVDLHGWDFTVFPRQLGWALLRTTLRDCVPVVHSAFAAALVQAGLERPPRRVQLGVDLERFAAAPRGSIWHSPLRLLTVGRLVAQKGHDVAVRVLADLRTGAPAVPAILRIVGEGPERPALERLATDLGLGCGDVLFAGALGIDEVAHEMAHADVLLVPSVAGADGSIEAFGRVALEGLAAGLAVIASESGGLPEAVGAAGRTVPPGDPAALAQAVREVTRKPPEAWARVARAHAARAPLARMWQQYEQVTSDVLRLAGGAGAGT